MFAWKPIKHLIGMGNGGKTFAIKEEMEREKGLKVTIPYIADDRMIEKAMSVFFDD
jgi:hypothetical protein